MHHFKLNMHLITIQPHTSNKKLKLLQGIVFEKQMQHDKNARRKFSLNICMNFHTTWHEKRWDHMLCTTKSSWWFSMIYPKCLMNPSKIIMLIYSCKTYDLGASHVKVMWKFMQMLSENFLVALLSCCICFSNTNPWSNFNFLLLVCGWMDNQMHI